MATKPSNRKQSSVAKPNQTFSTVLKTEHKEMFNVQMCNIYSGFHL